MSKRVSQIQTKSVKYFSDRGNDVYKPKQTIRIKVDPSSCPVLNPLETYLKFSLRIPQSASSSLVPDPQVYGFPFETITILDGTESTVLEQIDNADYLQAVKNYYSSNVNSDNIARVFKGKVSVNPSTFTSGAVDDPQASSLGGGLNSVYYQVEDASRSSYSGKSVEIIYRFECSGLLGNSDQILPLIAMNGLVIRLDLRDAETFLREVTISDAGKGAFNAGGDLILSDADTCYSITKYYDNAAALQNMPIPANTVITGLLLNQAADATGGLNKVAVANIQDFVGTIGSSMISNAATNGASANTQTYNPITSILKGQGAGANQVAVKFAALTTAAVAVPDKAPVCVIPSSTPTYELHEVQLICSVVETDSGYLQGLTSQTQSAKGLNLQYYTYQDYPINIQKNLVNQIYIPATQRRAFSLLTLPESLGSREPSFDNYKPSVTGLSNYQLVLNGINTPQLPVSLARLASGRVDPLHIIELEKSIDQSSIDLRTIDTPSDMFVIGRSLGRYNNSYNLNDNSLSMKLNYSAAPAQNQILHNFIYHIRTLNISSAGRRVLM